MHQFAQPGCTKRVNSRAWAAEGRELKRSRVSSGWSGFFFPEGLYLEASRNTDDMGENANMHPRALNSVPESPTPEPQPSSQQEA